MPSWSDENGRYWWVPPGRPWYDRIEIPHAPVSTEPGCTCAMCMHARAPKGPTAPRHGARVYHRRADLFGQVVGFEVEGRALVKYEWPYDPALPPVQVPFGELRQVS